MPSPTPRDLDRETLIAHVVSTLIATPGVLAIWEAGSAAFDRLDDYSDIDFGILADSGANPAIWDSLAALWEQLGGVALLWHEPDPLWAGLDKTTVRLANTSRWLQLDIGIFTHPAATLHNEEPRHGVTRILHDPQGLAAPGSFDAAAHREAMRRAFHHQIQRFAMHGGAWEKELARGRSIDAFRMYFGLTLSPLIAILGMRYRPARWDFAMRYLHDDFPPEVATFLTQCCYVATPDELPQRSAEIAQLFWETVDYLQTQGMSPIDLSGLDVSPVR